MVTSYRKELSTVWTRCSTEGEFADAIRAIGDAEVRVEPLTGPAMPLRQVAQALQLLKTDAGRHVKMMLRP